MARKRSGAEQLGSLMLLAAIYIQMESWPDVLGLERGQQVSRVAEVANVNRTTRTDTQTIVSKRNGSDEPTPSDLFLVSRGVLVRDKAVTRDLRASIETSDHVIGEARRQSGGNQDDGATVWLASEAIFDDDPVGSDTKSENFDLLQSIMNQTDGQQAADAANYQNAGQLIESSVGELNRSFLSLFDELWLIKNASAAALIRLNYFGNLSRILKRTKPRGQHATLTGVRQFDNHQFADGPPQRPHRNQFQRNKQAVASAKGQVVGRLSQAGLTIRGWLAGAQLQLAEMREKLLLPFRPSAVKFNEKSTSLNLPRLKPKPPDGDQATRNLVKRGIDTRNAADFDVVWQQQQQTSPCNKLTTDQENKCRAMERLVNSNLDDKFPGTMQAIEDNCRLINQLLTNCWIQQSIQLRMSLSSRNESLQRFVSSSSQQQSTGKTIAADSLKGLVNSCGVEPNSPQYIRDRVSWMWLNLCLDRRFRRGYTSNVYCLSVWTIPRAQQVCSIEYNRMQNYYSMSQSSSAQAAGNPTWTGISKSSEPTAPTARSLSDAGSNPTHDNVQLPAINQRANQTVLAEAAANSAAGVSSSQLVAATTRGLSEAELIDREVSSKMLCCMFDQFLRCIYKQAVWECGKRGAQFVVDFMSRIGTDDMKYLCNADSKPNYNSPETSSIPMLIPEPNYTNVPPTSWSGAPPVSVPTSEDNYRAPGGQNNTTASASNGGSNRNPFLENDYCIDSRIQNALASFNAASDITEQTSSMASKSPKVNPNRMRVPNYDPAYSDPRDTSASNAKCHSNYQTLAFFTFGSWLLIRITLIRFEPAKHKRL